MTITAFYNSGAPVEEFNERWGNKIKEKFPNYTIQYIQKAKGSELADLVTNGTKIDLYIDSIGILANPKALIDLNLQYDMSELIKKHNIDLKKFEPTTIEAIKNFGGLYGLPVHTTTLLLYYNKDIFDKFGVPYPKDGMTWEQLADLSRRLTVTDHDGRQYIGFSTSPGHLLRMNQLSLPFVDKNSLRAVINNENWKRFIQTTLVNPSQTDGYKTWVQKNGKIPPGDLFIKDRTLAMYLYFLDWKTQQAKEFETMNWDFVAAPTFHNLPGVGAQTYPTYFCVTSTSQYKEETMEIIKFVTSEEFQLSLSKTGVALPVLDTDAVKKVFAQKSSFKAKNNQAAFFHKFAAPMTRTPYDSQAEGQITKLLPQIVNGLLDINTALRTAEEEANKAIDAAKPK